MLTGYLIDVYRDTEENFDEDIYLDEVKDELDGWVIDAFKEIGCITAKNVLNTPRQLLIDKTDLEEDTVDNVLEILRAEFEDDAEPAAPDAAAPDAPEEPSEDAEPEA